MAHAGTAVCAVRIWWNIGCVIVVPLLAQLLMNTSRGTPADGGSSHVENGWNTWNTVLH